MKIRNPQPKISIITPSFNQGQFIEQTIQSVLSQNYPNIEYIIIDGGSTDGTLTILKKYSRHLRWVSERDNGQSQAINNGLKKATGSIIGYLNSDDYLEKNALTKVGNYFTEHKNAFWVTGKCKIINDKGKEIRRLITVYKNTLLKFLRFKSIFSVIQFISQPSTFWRREIIRDIGFFDESLHYDMDYDYWFRIWQRYSLFFIDEYLSCYRVHQAAKAMISPSTQFAVEYAIAKKYIDSPFLLFLHRIHTNIALLVYNHVFSRNSV